MRQILTVLLPTLASAFIVSAAPGNPGLAGVWEVWQLQEDQSPRQQEFFYVLRPDGQFGCATPGRMQMAGKYNVDGTRVELQPRDDSDSVTLTVTADGVMRGEKDSRVLEFRRRPIGRETVEKYLPGQWELVYDEPVDNPMRFNFAADGSWELIPGAGEAPEDATSGSFIVDGAGFIVLNDQDGREWVFTMEDNGAALRGFGVSANFRCRRVPPPPSK